MLASLTVNNSVLYKYNVKSKMLLSVICSICALFMTKFEPLLLMFVVTLSYSLLMQRYRILFVSYMFMTVVMLISMTCVNIIAIYLPMVKDSADFTKLAVPFMRGACVMTVVLPLTLTLTKQNLFTPLHTQQLPNMI